MCFYNLNNKKLKFEQGLYLDFMTYLKNMAIHCKTIQIDNEQNLMDWAPQFLQSEFSIVC
ncbi:MAG TPA: hypothetical protein TECP_01090 [Hyphomicrobiaceae bacterium MAG_BT-2024]